MQKYLNQMRSQYHYSFPPKKISELTGASTAYGRVINSKIHPKKSEAGATRNVHGSLIHVSW
jgi:hypothetical protein